MNLRHGRAIVELYTITRLSAEGYDETGRVNRTQRMGWIEITRMWQRRRQEA